VTSEQSQRSPSLLCFKARDEIVRGLGAPLTIALPSWLEVSEMAGKKGVHVTWAIELDVMCCCCCVVDACGRQTWVTMVH
jgi:hypothetical protein